MCRLSAAKTASWDQYGGREGGTERRTDAGCRNPTGKEKKKKKKKKKNPGNIFSQMEIHLKKQAG